MKLSVYSKQNLKDHPTKIALTNGLISLGHEVVEVETISDLSDFDRLLVFGGDGTMLYSATRSSIPIVGVNLGNIGFLTQFESNVTVEQLAAGLESNMLETRPLLETAFNGKTLYALNDFVVKAKSNHPIELSVKINGEYAQRYHADGVIVSSPTGSTAYSLSAGGPILAPNVDAIIINPICPHSLNSRALIVPKESIVEISIESSDAHLIADGREEINFGNTATIKILQSSKKATFVCSKTNFYKKLLEKMNKWGITD